MPKPAHAIRTGNIDEAAKAAGISAPTLISWMKVPEFDQTYREARSTQRR